MKTITAQDRSNLIKLASGLPKGDTTRRAILAGLVKISSDFDDHVKGKRFINPETGNKVLYKSLPPEEQSKIRARFDKSKNSDPANTKKNYDSAKSQAIKQVTDRFSEYGAGAFADGFKTEAEDAVSSLTSQIESALESGQLDSDSANKVWQEALNEISSQVDDAHQRELDHAEMDDDAGPKWERKADSAKKKVDALLAKQRKKTF